MARIFHQVPAIGELYCRWKGLGGGQSIAVTAVSGDNGDLRLGCQARLRRCWLLVRLQGDGLASLELADQCPIALIAPPDTVVDPDHC